jgi:hypothetical protein
MRFSRPRSGFAIVTILALASLCGMSLSAFAASKSASATLDIRVNVIPTINNVVNQPQKVDSGINFDGFQPSAAHYSVEIRPLPSQFLRDIPMKTNGVAAPQAPSVLQTTTIVLQ